MGVLSGQSRCQRRGHRQIASILVCAGLLVAACAGGTTPATDAVPAGSGLKPIEPAALQAVVDKTVQDLLIPGAVVLLRTPQGDFTAASGTTDLGTQNRPATDTHFRIASVTKTMTSAVILQLAQEGKLHLSDPVSKYVPGVPNGDDITLAELLKMRSGLYNYTDDPELAGFLDHDPTKVWTPQELLDMAFAHPPNAPPDTIFEYSNTNYVLLGQIAEKVDDKPLAAAMHDRLFEPLGLKNTMLPASTSNSIPEPYSHGYLYGSSSVVLTGTPPYTAEEIASAQAGTLQPNDYTGINHSFAAAAGAVISTSDDLATWMQALVGGRVLNAEYQRVWLDSVQPEDPGNPNREYGYGITRISWGPNTVYLHGGETPGYNTEASVDPANQTTLVVWANLTVSPVDSRDAANSVLLKVMDQIYAASPLAPSPLAPQPTPPLATPPLPTPTTR
ncbi:serine hydrolase domain-containing protein [Pseudonocardia aurantiaca]|uniref:Serine hydrolase domain-containing protein n=1 Tax=Pseudonocardia aurantiaca TaxID=75290 RepID=A0ABW4FSU4_9PSEU